MKKVKKWTKEEILADSKRFKYRNLWRVKSKGAYAAAVKFNILEECYSHMAETRNPYKCGGVIYVFEFNDNSCYVGLSSNLKKRFGSHMERGPVYKKISSGAIFKFKILEHKTDYPLETKEKEKFWAAYYELNSWELLNDKKSLGALGGSIVKWSKKRIEESSKRFTSIKDWREGEEGSYRAAIRLGILDRLSIGKVKGKGKGEDNPLFNKPNDLVRGSKHGNSVLCESDVLFIRKRILNGENK
jgi:hypothetical protein